MDGLLSVRPREVLFEMELVVNGAKIFISKFY